MVDGIEVLRLMNMVASFSKGDEDGRFVYHLSLACFGQGAKLHFVEKGSES